MNPRNHPSSDAILLPVAVLILAMVGFQTGAALAKTLIPVVGPSGAVALRLFYATLMLWLVWRPWRMRVDRKAARTVLIYGVALGCMNLLFYCALQRIPLGIAVALEFTGPLGVAIAAAIRPLDFLWVALAVLGVLMVLPLSGASQPLDWLGIVFALGGGVCWALYIVFGRRAGLQSGGQTTAMGMLIGAICIAPFGVAHAGAALFKPEILPTAIAVAFLSSALPYSLEMYAMTRVPARIFGVLMSLDPALAATAGLILLGERLSWLQWSAIACIVFASAGSAAGHKAEPR
jgi:inner membrane transporter RhtA